MTEVIESENSFSLPSPPTSPKRNNEEQGTHSIEGSENTVVDGDHEDEEEGEPVSVKDEPGKLNNKPLGGEMIQLFFLRERQLSEGHALIWYQIELYYVLTMKLSLATASVLVQGWRRKQLNSQSSN